MKKGIIISISLSLLLLISCKTAQQHIEAADKHTQKAVMKGAVITKDSDTVTVDNIIIDTVSVNDTTYITKTITKVITEKGEIRYITKRDKRVEAKLEERIRKDSIEIVKLTIRKNARVDVNSVKQQGKTDRTVSRQENKKNKWWLFIIIGIMIGIASTIATKLLINKFI